MGLAKLGTVAIDGTKMGANASLRANRGKEALRAEVDAIMDQAQALDAAEQTSLGEDSVQELPRGLGRSASRLSRLQAALAEVERAEAEAKTEADAKQARAEAEAAGGRRLPGVKPKKPRSALARAEADAKAAEVRAERKARSRAAKEARARAYAILARAAVLGGPPTRDGDLGR